MPTDTELRERLAATVAAVEPPPDIVERARLGGRRRLRRHRTITTAAVLATTAVAGFLVIGTNPLADPTPDPARPTDQRSTEPHAKFDPYHWLMVQPPRGELVQNEEYVREVKTAWQRSHAKSSLRTRGAFDDLRGEPKVAWAGQTPAGKAAVVVQAAHLRREPLNSDSGGLGTLIGFVGEDAAGHARLIEDHYPEQDRPRYGLMLGRTLVVLDDGHPTGYATRREYGEDGSITRHWTPLSFDDGAAIVTLPAETNLAAVRLGRLHHRDFLRIAGQPRVDNQVPSSWESSFQTYSKASGTPVRDEPPGGSWLLTPGLGRHSDRESLPEFLAMTLTSADPVAARTVEASWQANGVTPNGSAVGATAVAFDDEQFHAYADFKSRDGKDRTVHGGVVDWAAVLPVVIRLPDEQGWVTVSPGATIQYRVAAGTWSEAHENALLVPDGPGVDEVRVTRRGVPRLVGLE